MDISEAGMCLKEATGFRDKQFMLLLQSMLVNRTRVGKDSASIGLLYSPALPSPSTVYLSQYEYAHFALTKCLL